MFWRSLSFCVFKEGKTIVEDETPPSSVALHPSVGLLLAFDLLHFGGAGFGHLDGGLALGVEQRSLQRSRSGLGVGGGVAVSPRPKLVLAVTDVLLPVAGDLAGNLVGVIFAGGVSHTVPAVSVFRYALPVPSLCGGALGGRPGLVMPAFVMFGSSAGLSGECQGQEQQQRH